VPTTPTARRARLCGCYVTVPTAFRDGDLAVDLPAIQRHVRFLVEHGIATGTGVLLAGGAAGDFSTMTFEERVDVAAAVVDAAAGRVPVVMGAQTTSTSELVRLACAAERVGAEFIQVSPPFYFAHTADDFHEYVLAAAEAADIGLIVYNTFWTSSAIATSALDRLAALPSAIGLKWSMPDTGFMEFERVVSGYSDRFSIIDNQMRFVSSHMLGGRGIEVHVCNYDPEWGVRVWRLLEAHQYVEAQRELVNVALPFMTLWQEMEEFTSGDGYLDKLCMELVGLGSSRCRPPTRDVRDRFRDRARQMLEATGVLPRSSATGGDGHR
jgi:dihydrodipicolinate synthase/N-acetylneuraminate lyase